MKRSKIALVMGVVIVQLYGTGWATLVYDDGGYHRISSRIDDSVIVDYCCPGVGTQVEVARYGSVQGLRAYEDSEVTVSGGGWSPGTVRMELVLYDRAHATVSGGRLQMGLRARHSSQANITGGEISPVLWASGQSQLNISGGDLVMSLYAHEESRVTISGGVFRGPGNFAISVGQKWGELDSSIVTIIGTGFAIHGEPVPHGRYYHSHYPSGGYLSGRLASGESLNVRFSIWDQSTLVLAAEPSTPPVADAGGPYTIYVGDTLTLDANGSTDVDGDIVSYMWDLDDNGSFETNAGGHPIFDVNYTYLQSLGLLVEHTYNIRLKVADSEGQSDVNDSTLTIVPQPAIQVAVDIKPTSCPNPLNVKSSGILPAAVLGSEELDVNTIDATSIELAGVGAVRHNLEDVATPVPDVNDCNCTTAGPDGYTDLTLKFLTQEIVEAIGDVNDGDVLPLALTGVVFGERPIEGADCIVIRGKAKSLHGADINKDNVVDMADFAIFAQNWLQSSIVDD
jgi:hypothetical protein